MEPSSHAIARFIVSPSRPSSAIPTRLGKRAGSKTPSAACAASFRAKPISQRSKTNASILSSVPTTTLRENALTSELQPRPSAKCCTSNVNPPPRFRGDDSGKFVGRVSRRRNPPPHQRWRNTLRYSALRRRRWLDGIRRLRPRRQAVAVQVGAVHVEPDLGALEVRVEA